MISIPIYRACVLCNHGRTTNQPGLKSGEDRVCVCPQVTGRATVVDWPMGVPVDKARANHGPCGPEAHHLAFTGLLP